MNNDGMDDGTSEEMRAEVRATLEVPLQKISEAFERVGVEDEQIFDLMEELAETCEKDETVINIDPLIQRLHEEASHWPKIVTDILQKRSKRWPVQSVEEMRRLLVKGGAQLSESCMAVSQLAEYQKAQQEGGLPHSRGDVAAFILVQDFLEQVGANSTPENVAAVLGWKGPLLRPQ